MFNTPLNDHYYVHKVRKFLRAANKRGVARALVPDTLSKQKYVFPLSRHLIFDVHSVVFWIVTVSMRMLILKYGPRLSDLSSVPFRTIVSIINT